MKDDNILFNKYGNVTFRSLLDLFSRKGPFTKDDLALTFDRCDLDKRKKDDLFSEIPRPLLIKDAAGYYHFEEKLTRFAAPPSNLEIEYLQSVLDTREARLFSDNAFGFDTAQKKPNRLDYIVRANTNGKRHEPELIDTGIFRTILDAIYEKRRIITEYTTNSSDELHTGTVIPFRFEYSVFDGRWWLIEYSEDEQRPIKAKISNIKKVTLGDKHGVSDDTIKESILGRLVKEPLRLEIVDHKNAAERCFMLFENMMEISARRMDKNKPEKFEMSFRYFSWDVDQIVKKLLFLGEMVTVIDPPEIIRSKLAEKLKQAIK